MNLDRAWPRGSVWATKDQRQNEKRREEKRREEVRHKVAISVPEGALIRGKIWLAPPMKYWPEAEPE